MEEEEHSRMLQEYEEHVHIGGSIDDGRPSQAPPAPGPCTSIQTSKGIMGSIIVVESTVLSGFRLPIQCEQRSHTLQYISLVTVMTLTEHDCSLHLYVKEATCSTCGFSWRPPPPPWCVQVFPPQIEDGRHYVDDIQ